MDGYYVLKPSPQMDSTKSNEAIEYAGYISTKR